jgi:UDP-N-acetylmuramoylalanine--D-glutamate ligase
MKNAHVIGLGRSGIAAARLLQRHGWQVVLSDRNPNPPQADQIPQLQQEGILVLLDYSFVPDSRTNLVVVSPGVPWDIPALVSARDMGLEVIGEMELAWRFLEDRPWVGITGTNGKTTTTALTAAIFQAAGFDAPACGNIGYAACELALVNQVPDWMIAELSSYQIESAATLAPRVGIWTTLTPDHLQRHKTLENYWQIKASLMHRSDAAVLNGDDSFLRQHMPGQFKELYWTSIHGKRAIAPIQPATYIQDGWVTFEALPIVRADALKMDGEHNLQNLLLAVTAACLAGLDPEAIAKGVTEFPGVPHRLEHICTWQGVGFVNDSKATNYDAAEVGLRSVEAPVVLIAGGEAKEGDDTAWLHQIQAKASAVLLIGAAAPQFAQRIGQMGYDHYEIVETMARAVDRGAELAQAQGAKTVLLSPACASFDQYLNFEVRGDHFRQLCQEKFT